MIGYTLSMNKFSTVLLDADGVINDGTLLDLQRDFGIAPERMQAFFRGPFREECLVGKKDLRDALLLVLNEWGWTGTVDELLAYWFKQGHSIRNSVKNVVHALRTKHIPVHLVTNQEKHRAEYMRDAMGYGELFTAIHASCDIGYAKPAREYFEAVHRRIGNPEPSSVLFWDDSQKNVEAAKEIGFDAHMFSNEDQFVEAMKEYFGV